MNLLAQVRKYIESTQPLGIKHFDLKDLGAGEYNKNFLLATKTHKYAVRISVSQLSGAKDQLKHEYDTLMYLKGQHIAPTPYFIDMTGFHFPLLIEEFVEGRPITKLSHDILDKIGSIIARINNVSITDPHSFTYRSIDYLRDVSAHQQTYEKLSSNEYNKPWFSQLDTLFRSTRAILEHCPVNTPSMFIRRDANPSNFILTDRDIRMVDWEIARIDDPLITLASFINEVTLYDALNLQPTAQDIERVKEAFLRDCPIPEFETLLYNRLIIEELGGLVWALERIDTLINKPLTDTSSHDKLIWYQEVARLSYDALSSSLNH